jgi:hypothetical protein
MREGKIDAHGAAGNLSSGYEGMMHELYQKDGFRR